LVNVVSQMAHSLSTAKRQGTAHTSTLREPVVRWRGQGWGEPVEGGRVIVVHEPALQRLHVRRAHVLAHEAHHHLQQLPQLLLQWPRGVRLGYVSGLVGSSRTSKAEPRRQQNGWILKRLQSGVNPSSRGLCGGDALLLFTGAAGNRSSSGFTGHPPTSRSAVVASIVSSSASRPTGRRGVATVVGCVA
jgi:hypothetical protein